MYANALLAVDLGEDSWWTKALPRAVESAKACAAKLHLVTVVPDFGMSVVGQYFPDDFAATAVAQAGQDLKSFADAHIPAGGSVDTLVGHGSVYEEVLRSAADIGCDLIVMAAQRPALKDFLLGPNAARVVRHADCSVLVVRA